MKLLAVFALVALASAWAVPLETSTFPTKYDNINVLEILQNSRVAHNYLGCLKGAKKCTPDGALLKDAVPKALANDCDGCSAKQKEWMEIALPYISKHYPKEWKELEEMYDPTHKYRNKHEKLAEKHGVTV